MTETKVELSYLEILLFLIQLLGQRRSGQTGLRGEAGAPGEFREHWEKTSPSRQRLPRARGSRSRLSRALYTCSLMGSHRAAKATSLVSSRARSVCSQTPSLTPPTAPPSPLLCSPRAGLVHPQCQSQRVADLDLVLYFAAILVTFLALSGKREMLETLRSPPDPPPKPRPLLTQTVVSIMCQVESVVAGTSIVARDVDTVVHAACIILSLTLVHICGQRGARQLDPPASPHSPALGSALWWFFFFF